MAVASERPVAGMNESYKAPRYAYIKPRSNEEVVGKPRERVMEGIPVPVRLTHLREKSS